MPFPPPLPFVFLRPRDPGAALDLRPVPGPLPGARRPVRVHRSRVRRHHRLLDPHVGLPVQRVPVGRPPRRQLHVRGRHRHQPGLLPLPQHHLGQRNVNQFQGD